MSGPRKFGNAKQTVEALGLPFTADTLRRWANRGKVPSSRIGHRTRLFDLELVAEALGGRTIKGGSNE